MNKHILFVLFVSTTFIACEKEVVLDFEHEPKLCLNCILNPDSTIIATLTLSKKLDNTNDFICIENASIFLYEQNVLLGKFEEKGEGKYILNQKPIEGKNYNIIASVNGHISVSASTTVPNKPKVTYFKDKIAYDNYNTPRYDLKVQIADDVGTDNYWLYSTGTVNGVKTGGGCMPINAPFVDNFNRSIEIDQENGFKFFLQIRITDEGYDGEKMEFMIPDLVPNTENRHFDQHFLNADQNYDKYIKTTIINRMKEDSDLPFYEPIQIHSNVINGYGLFGSCAITTIKL